MIFVVDGMMCTVFVDAQLEVLSCLRLLSNPRSSRLLLENHFSFLSVSFLCRNLLVQSSFSSCAACTPARIRGSRTCGSCSRWIRQEGEDASSVDFSHPSEASFVVKLRCLKRLKCSLLVVHEVGLRVGYSCCSSDSCAV